MKNLEDMLKEIEARASAATEGPWVGMIVPDDYSVHTFNLLAITDEKEIVPTAAFIEHARTDVPKLLAMLRLAMEQRDTAYTCSWDKGLVGMIADDDLALLAVGRGE